MDKLWPGKLNLEKMTAIQKTETPWQLAMFSKSIKKQLKLEALLDLLGPVDGRSCLLISCGDNSGALNWHFREKGGAWTWGDVEGDNVTEMSSFLGDPVYHTEEHQFPFEDSQFERIVCIDVLEHLDDPAPFLSEMKRVMTPDAQTVVTVPNGDPTLTANKIKSLVGMTPEQYGHTRAGFTIPELTDVLEDHGYQSVRSGGYSRFFTEMMELVINFAYVFVLSKKDKNKKDEPDGKIAPTSSNEMKSHGGAFKIYALLYPFMSAFSKLDNLLSDRSNNAVIVVAEKRRSP